MNQEAAIITNPQETEEELLLLQQQPPIINCSSCFNEPSATTDRLSHLCLTNSFTPCTTCSCTSTSATSSASHKRPSSENPTITHDQPIPKKPNNNTHSLCGFSKIPLSTPPIPFLRRCSSDPYNPPLQPVAEEPPQSPPSPPLNAYMPCPATPLSSAIPSAKLPPRPRPRTPTLRRSVSDPIPSPAKTICSSCDSPQAQWLRKMRDCLMEMGRKWEEIFAFEDDSPTEETKNDNNTDATVDNSLEEYVEAVSVEKTGECSTIQFKCPCGNCYKILLYGGNCFYKLM